MPCFKSKMCGQSLAFTPKCLGIEALLLNQNAWKHLWLKSKYWIWERVLHCTQNVSRKPFQEDSNPKCLNKKAFLLIKSLAWNQNLFRKVLFCTSLGLNSACLSKLLLLILNLSRKVLLLKKMFLKMSWTKSKI